MEESSGEQEKITRDLIKHLKKMEKILETATEEINCHYTTRVSCPLCKVVSLFDMNKDSLSVVDDYTTGLSKTQVYRKMISHLKHVLREYELKIIELTADTPTEQPDTTDVRRKCPHCNKECPSIYAYYKHVQVCNYSQETTLVTVPSDYKAAIPFDISHIDYSSIYSRYRETPTQIIRYMITQIFLNTNNKCVEVRQGPTSRLLRIHIGYNKWENLPYKGVQIQLLHSICISLITIVNHYLANPDINNPELTLAMRSTLIVAAKIIEKIKNEELGEVHKRYKKVYIEEIMKELRGVPEAPVGAATETDTSLTTPVSPQ